MLQNTVEHVLGFPRLFFSHVFAMRNILECHEFGRGVPSAQTRASETNAHQHKYILGRHGKNPRLLQRVVVSFGNCA